MVQLFESVISQNAVFFYYRNDVRRNAHGAEVEQLHEFVELDTVANGESLHQLETYAAAAQMVVRVVVVGALWIQNGNGGRQHCIGHMVIADNEVDTQILGVSNFLNSLDTTV